MKNKIIQNLLRSMKNDRTENIRSRKTRIMAVALCAALALGQAGAVVYAQSSGDRIVVQTAGGRADATGTGNMEGTQMTVNMGKSASGGAPINMLLASGTTPSGGTSGTGTSSGSGTAPGTGTASGPEQSSGSEDSRTAKEETVYILANANGSVQKIIVSDWLKNGAGKRTLNDVSELTDIENIRDDLQYTGEDGNVKVWDAQGNDIYYQGNTDKELPVTL